jgi:Fe2+ or Zn2+ uptake regulation protein
MHEATVSETARAILEHLRQNPEAQDTVAGIVHWWLPSQAIEPRTATIIDALRELVKAGLVMEFEGKDLQISYRLTNRELRDPDSKEPIPPTVY